MATAPKRQDMSDPGMLIHVGGFPMPGIGDMDAPCQALLMPFTRVGLRERKHASTSTSMMSAAETWGLRTWTFSLSRALLPECEMSHISL